MIKNDEHLAEINAKIESFERMLNSWGDYEQIMSDTDPLLMAIEKEALQYKIFLLHMEIKIYGNAQKDS